MTGSHRRGDSSVWYRCPGCHSTHEVEHIRHAMYVGQRTLGDWQALRRGRLGRRLVRRAITKRLMRQLWR